MPCQWILQRLLALMRNEWLWHPWTLRIRSWTVWEDQRWRNIEVEYVNTVNMIVSQNSKGKQFSTQNLNFTLSSVLSLGNLRIPTLLVLFETSQPGDPSRQRCTSSQESFTWNNSSGCYLKQKTKLIFLCFLLERGWKINLLGHRWIVKERILPNINPWSKFLLRHFF